MTIPILLLDVDGVLNAVDHPQPDTERGWPDYRHTIGLAQNTGFHIWYSPTVVKFISDLHTSGKAEVRWLTTWCDDARDFLAPDLGLPAFKVQKNFYFHTGIEWWKLLEAVQVAEEGRPLIWLDDDLQFDLEAMEWVEINGHLGISPDTSLGLVQSELTTIENWIGAL